MKNGVDPGVLILVSDLTYMAILLTSANWAYGERDEAVFYCSFVSCFSQQASPRAFVLQRPENKLNGRLNKELVANFSSDILNGAISKVSFCL